MKKEKVILIPYNWYNQLHQEGFVNGSPGWFIPDKISSKEVRKFLKQVKKENK